MKRATADTARAALLIVVATLAMVVAYATPAAVEVAPSQHGPVCPAPDPEGYR